jgi:phage N-6-adenine-methyltransferase
MINRDGLPTSDHWQTPAWLYQALDAEFHFDFDPCPLHATFDGLQIEWGHSNYVNPPYNRRDKPQFIHKAIQEWQKGKTVVLLIPAAMGTTQTHTLLLKYADEIRFFRGRLAFCGYNTKGQYTTTNKGKHDSMLVIFKSGTYADKLATPTPQPKFSSISSHPNAT